MFKFLLFAMSVVLISASGIARSEEAVRVVPLCGLLDFADRQALWGSDIEIEGTLFTDTMTYGWVSDGCGNLVFSTSHLSDRSGVALMDDALSALCNRSYCTIEANVVFRGVLKRDAEQDYGMILLLNEVVRFEVVGH